MDDEQRIVFEKAQTALLAIPGHAEYYRDRILQAQERLKNRVGEAPWSDYREEIMYGFQTLPHLPSSEGVRVLGELFSNDWVPPGNETAVASEKFAPLSVSARVALQKFPLVDKPFKDPITKNNVSDANAAWQLWYEQIKAGKRTFRFEGDPTEYDLNGPAAKQKLDHISRDRKRDAQRDAGLHSPGKLSEKETASKTEDHPEPGIVAALVATCLLVIVAIGFYMKTRIRS